MATLDYFTVTCNGIGAVGIDYVDADIDPDEDIVYAFVDFEPRLEPGTVIWAPTLTPPRGIVLDPARGRFDVDGVLRTIVGDPSNEKQLVTLTNATGGTFTLTYSGQTTAAIPYNAAPSEVRTALENLSNIGTGDVQVQGTAIAEQQTITVTGATGGSYTLTYKGQTTVAIPYNSSAANIKTRLEDLSSISTGSITVTGTNPYTVTFTGVYAGQDVGQMTATSSLTPGGSTVVVNTTVAGINAGPWTVTFTGALASQNVAQMTANAASLTGSSPTAVVTTPSQGDLAAGVALVANTTVISTPLTAIGVSTLIYDVIFTIPQSDRILNPFAIAAPTTTGVTVDLASVTKLPPKDT